MRALYIDRYYMTDSNNCVLTGISLPILKRKIIRTNLRIISDKTLKFDDVDAYNIETYYNYIKYFIKDNDMTAISLKIVRYKRFQYCRQLFKIINNQYELYNKEPMRVYIPFDSNKDFLKTLNIMAKKRKMQVQIEEIKYEESKISQISNLIAGCVYYHSREDLYYENNLGERGKPQLIAYLYSCKKKKNKHNIIYYDSSKN